MRETAEGPGTPRAGALGVLVRTVRRFLHRGGTTLAASMAYHAVFAVFAALWVLLVVAGFWLRSDTRVSSAVFTAIDGFSPGLVGAHGILSPKTLLAEGTLQWTGIVAFVGLVWKTTSWTSSTRSAVRQVLGLDGDARGVVVRKLLDLATAAVLGLLLLLSALLSVAASSVLGATLRALGLHGSWIASTAASALGLLGAWVAGTVAVAFLYHVLAGVRVSRRTLLIASAAVGAALVVMSTASGWIVRGTSNPLTTSVTAVLGLFVWFNLVSAVILVGAAGMGAAERLPRHGGAEEGAR